MTILLLQSGPGGGGAGGGAGGGVSFDGVATGVTLSNGNLTATHTNTTTAQGARSTANKSSGKYYFEITVGATHGGGDNAGILLSSGTYTDMTNGNNCCAAFLTFSGGVIYSNNGASGGALGTACVAGDIIRICIDLTARKAWFSRNNTNIWNNRAGVDDPVTGASIVTIAAGSFAPAVQFGSGASANGDNMTANFGATAYTYTVPSGFGNWPL